MCQELLCFLVWKIIMVVFDVLGVSQGVVNDYCGGWGVYRVIRPVDVILVD